MSTGSREHTDVTGEAAVGDVASESLFAEVLSRIDDETDRILIFAAVGLGISERHLSLALTMDTADLTARIDKILSALREAQEVADKLHDFRRAGRVENYLALAYRLGLQDWFCAQCQRFMVQSERGRRRKTCSGRCRLRRFRGHRPGTTAPETRSAWAVDPAAVPDEMVSRLVAPIDLAQQPVYLDPRILRWWQPERRLRDRAVVLLGFSCGVALTPADIAALDVDDLIRTTEGVELRLYRGTTRPTRYVTIPARQERICPAAALLDWTRHLADAGHRSGALFPRLDARGKPIATRLTGRAVATIIEAAAAEAFEQAIPTRLGVSTPVLSLTSGR
jgi:hypothetical protein